MSITKDEFIKKWRETIENWHFQDIDEISSKFIDEYRVKEAFETAKNADFKKDNWDTISDYFEEYDFDINLDPLTELQELWQGSLFSFAEYLEEKYDSEKPTPQPQISLENSVILDTETTGLGRDDEIVQIAIIDGETGETLLNELVKPTKSISKESSNIHNITNEKVANSPSYIEIHQKVLTILNDKNIIVYNSDFDLRMIKKTASKYNIDSEIEPKNVTCVMEWYAQFWGDFNDYFGTYKWQKLTSAARQQSIDISDLTAHDALSDCEITRRLINVVNNKLSKN